MKESTALQICVRNRLEKIKLNDYEYSSSFFTDFEKLINELNNSGANVSEKEKLNYMLRTLPELLSYIGDLIDAVRETDQNCEFIKNKIILWEIREKVKIVKITTNRASSRSKKNSQRKRALGVKNQGM